MCFARYLDRVPRSSLASLVSSLVLTLVCLGCSDSDSSTDPTPDPEPRADAGADSGSTAAPDGVVTWEVLDGCPIVSDIVSTTEWTACVRGKRFVGKDVLTGVPCELRFRDDGGFDYEKNGVVTSTPPFAEWKSPIGNYSNTSGSGNRRLSGVLLSGLASPPENYGIKLDIREAANLPADHGANEDHARFILGDAVSEETCKLDYL